MIPGSLKIFMLRDYFEKTNESYDDGKLLAIETIWDISFRREKQ